MGKLPARSNKTELQGFEVFLSYPLVFGLWSSVSPLLPSLPGHCHCSSSWCRGACCELLGFAEFACDVLTMGQFQILMDFFMLSERSLVLGQKNGAKRVPQTVPERKGVPETTHSGTHSGEKNVVFAIPLLQQTFSTAESGPS